MRTEDEKREILLQGMQRADELRPFAESPHIQQWFADRERVLMEEMITGPFTDDEHRRRCVMQIQTLRDLRGFLMGAMVRGERAAIELSKMETTNGP